MSIIGLPVYIIQRQESLESKSIEFYDNFGYSKDGLFIYLNAAYTIVVIIWSSIFVCKWGAKERLLAFQWGQLNYELSENKLQGYYGYERRSPINDELRELYYPSMSRAIKVAFSLLISFLIIIALAVVVGLLLFFKNWIIQSKWGGQLNDYLVYLPSK